MGHNPPTQPLGLCTGLALNLGYTTRVGCEGEGEGCVLVLHDYLGRAVVFHRCESCKSPLPHATVYHAQLFVKLR